MKRKKRRVSAHVRPKNQISSNFKQIGMVVLIAAVLFLYILLIVETDMLSTEIQELKKTEKRMLDEREKLQAQQVGLAGFGRIEKLAKGLGLEHPARGNVIEIPSE